MRRPIMRARFELVNKMRTIIGSLPTYSFSFFMGLFLYITTSNYMLPERLLNFLFNYVQENVLSVHIYL